MNYLFTPLVGAVLVVSMNMVTAADNPYAGQQNRQIKALSEQEVDDYLNGRGMGTSKAAELNHYPGPRHVLDHAHKLGLSAEQAAQTQAAHDAMAEVARRIGTQIVAKEAELEELYASAQADMENTKRLVHEIAGLQAEFRLTHLNAHLSMRRILTPQQISAYDRLRGYVGGGAHPHSHAHH